MVTWRAVRLRASVCACHLDFLAANAVPWRGKTSGIFSFSFTRRDFRLADTVLKGYRNTHGTEKRQGRHGRLSLTFQLSSCLATVWYNSGTKAAAWSTKHTCLFATINRGEKPFKCNYVDLSCFSKHTSLKTILSSTWYYITSFLLPLLRSHLTLFISLIWCLHFGIACERCSTQK